MLLRFLVLIFALANVSYGYIVQRPTDKRSGAVCSQPCSENLYDPVCGSDGKTYDNNCVFNDASICQNLHLTIVHKGRCKVECSKGCNENLYDPLCGSDGKTYDNKCVFDDAAICRNLRITVVHSGRCEVPNSAKTCLEYKLLNQRHLLGQYIPDCEADGTYKEKQCKEMYCFCVNTKTGKEILGTRRRGMPKVCDTPCIRERHRQLKIISTFGWLGVPSPRCSPNGKYNKVQCVGSHCFCVHPGTGKPIPGRRLMLKNSNTPNCELKM